VRDLLCHHSGLPRHDWIWMPGDLSDDIRTTFQYLNLGYLVASMVTERVSGQSWLEFTRARLTDKLHMNVTFTVEDLAAAADAAVPYAMDGDTRLRAKRWPIRVQAAGGINTSIARFANWLRLHLDKGEFEGQRLLSPALIQQLHTPRVHEAAPAFAEYGDMHCGLGFRLHSYRGERVVLHGGGWIGWGTRMAMLPIVASVLLFSLIVIQARFRKFSPIVSSTGCAARSRYPGSIVIVSCAASSWRRWKVTARLERRRGMLVPDPAVLRPSTRESSSTRVMAGSTSPRSAMMRERP
jgi:hypothetical protein